jgi:hypothetical protein
MRGDYTRRELYGLGSPANRGLLKTHKSHRIMLLTVDGNDIDGISDVDGYLNIANETDDLLQMPFIVVWKLLVNYFRHPHHYFHYQRDQKKRNFKKCDLDECFSSSITIVYYSCFINVHFTCCY